MNIQLYEKKYQEEVIKVLLEVFPGFCQNYDDALLEINNIYENNGFCLVAFENEVLVGIVGAIPQYKMTGWELHPLAVLKEYRKKGYGSALVSKLEYEVDIRGGVMIYLGSDDEDGKTSLFGIDLYENTFSKIEEIKNIDNHPYSFYEKQGYKIVGVFPDANGLGKPDIWLAKRIKKL